MFIRFVCAFRSSIEPSCRFKLAVGQLPDGQVAVLDGLSSAPIEPVDNLARRRQVALFGAIEQFVSDPAQSKGSTAKTHLDGMLHVVIFPAPGGLGNVSTPSFLLFDFCPPDGNACWSGLSKVSYAGTLGTNSHSGADGVSRQI